MNIYAEKKAYLHILQYGSTVSFKDPAGML